MALPFDEKSTREFQRDMMRYLEEVERLQAVKQQAKRRDLTYYDQFMPNPSSSIERRTFEYMIRAKLDDVLIQKLSASADFGLMTEDWEVMRSSLTQRIQRESKLTYREAGPDMMREERVARVDFEVPRIIHSFSISAYQLDRLPR